MALDPKSSERARTQRPGVRIAAVVSRFHDELTGAMLESARQELLASGMAENDFQVAWVPGSFELPLVARRFARRDDVDAVLCLGLILKGETTHDQYVAMGATQGIVQAMLETDKPILMGVLTCQTIEQARARALPPQASPQANKGGGEDGEDKGREVARAALATLEALDRAQRTPETQR
ncbi:MAG: 6,7-dimethyl-8-ribityllumazine synthase [bacterium]|nr:6,7-dimethyl-8-ribityllumazine synthase [bacterium]